MSEIAVLGSVNMDLIIDVEAFPNPGQTVKASDFQQLPGGKGANQAVAAAKLGGDVSMYGLIGEDNYAKKLRCSLLNAGVNTAGIQSRAGPSGFAIVSVNEQGENEIVIVPGANGLIDRHYTQSIVKDVSSAKILLLQLEIPLNSIKGILEQLPEDSPKVILDPAPAVPMEDLPLDKVDLLTPNENELKVLSNGLKTDKLIDQILHIGLEALILKKGEKGSEYISCEARYSVPPFNVSSIDTTGAGDTFNGALAVALAKNMDMFEALKFANTAGACATLKRGAQPSIPTLQKVKEFVKDQSSRIDCKFPVKNFA